MIIEKLKRLCDSNMPSLSMNRSANYSTDNSTKSHFHHKHHHSSDHHLKLQGKEYRSTSGHNKHHYCKNHSHTHSPYNYKDNELDINYHPYHSDENHYHHHHHNHNIENDPIENLSYSHNNRYHDNHHPERLNTQQLSSYDLNNQPEYSYNVSTDCVQPISTHPQYYGTQSSSLIIPDPQGIRWEQFNNTSDTNFNPSINKSPSYYSHYHDKTILATNNNQDNTSPNHNRDPSFKTREAKSYVNESTSTERLDLINPTIDELYENKLGIKSERYIPISITRTDRSKNLNLHTDKLVPLSQSIDHYVYDQHTLEGHSIIAITDQEKAYSITPSTKSFNKMENHQGPYTHEAKKGNWYSDDGQVMKPEVTNDIPSNYNNTPNISGDRELYKSKYATSDSSREGGLYQYYNNSLSDSGFADKSDISFNQSRDTPESLRSKSPIASYNNRELPSDIIEKDALNSTFEEHGSPNIFRARLDLTHFKQQEIDAKIIDDKIIVTAQHGERADPVLPKGGVTKREFFTSYTLPPDCNPDKVRAYMTQNGYLTIECIRDINLSRDCRYNEAVPIHIK